jgi:hypothetical protein
MKRAILIILLIMMLVLWLGLTAFTNGDKVRGDRGQGCVNQNQVQDPPPFQP